MADPIAKVVLDKNLLANLNAVSPRVKRAVMRPAFRKGAALVAKNAKKKVPVRYGYLKKSIKSASSKRGENGRVYVDPKKAYDEPRAHTKTGQVIPANYAHLVEFGTKTASAHPFLRPALAETKGAAMDAITAEAKRQFDKQFQKGRTGV